MKPPLSRMAIRLAHETVGANRAEAKAFAADEILPPNSSIEHGQFAVANDSRFIQAHFSRPLTTFSAGYRDPGRIEKAQEFFAPRVPVSRRFEYGIHDNPEEFYSSTTEDLRAPLADFTRVEYKSRKLGARTFNRGLTLRVDLDQVVEVGDWQERYTAKLIRRLRRNSLRRAVALLDASAINTNKTWDFTVGKDPDADVRFELIGATNASGIRPSRVAYGDKAWERRKLSHRAQSSAGGFSSASLSGAELANLLEVDDVITSEEYFHDGTGVKALLDDEVLMFNAQSGADPEDPSNIKRFVTPIPGFGDMRVYLHQVTAKLVDLTVEHYELIAITSLLGIRKITTD